MAKHVKCNLNVLCTLIRPDSRRETKIVNRFFKALYFQDGTSRRKVGHFRRRVEDFDVKLIFRRRVEDFDVAKVGHFRRRVEDFDVRSDIFDVGSKIST